jgi:hypothetical protein
MHEVQRGALRPEANGMRRFSHCSSEDEAHGRLPRLFGSAAYQNTD